MQIANNLFLRMYPEMKEKDSKGMVPIYVKVTVKGTEPKEFSTGVKNLATLWNPDAWKFDGKGQDILFSNQFLGKVKSNITKHYYLLDAEYQYVTSELVYKAYKGLLNPKPKSETRTLCQTFNFKYSLFAHQVKKGLRSDSTLRKWKSTKQKIRAFLKSKYQKKDLLLSSFTHEDALDFMNYLTLVEDLEESTARKYIKNTKELFEIATARKWIPSNPWSGFTIKQDNKDREILSMIDIYALHNHKFTGRLDWVRDCALFGIFTGYAFCELDNFQKTDIFLGNDGSRWIKIDRKKTGKPELMPLLPIPAAIVDKYWEDPYCVANGKLLPLRSYQKFNGYLKELAGICQLSSEPTPHILRHTFATTICLDNGVSMETVMRLLGHTNIRTTQIYAKVTRKKLSEDMGDLQKKLFKFDGSLVKMEDDVMKLIAKHVEKMAS